jgi:hypothetical protein
MFYELMRSTIEDGADFMDGEWARLHYDVLERHHLSRHCPSDVTLFDVLEMLFDCVSAGMTRSGSVYPIEISNEILQKAVSNTVDYLVKHIEVADRKTEPQNECTNCGCTDDCTECHEEAKWCKDEPQTYITEDRDTQILDAWQVHHRNTTSVEDEPQTEREGE